MDEDDIFEELEIEGFTEEVNKFLKKLKVRDREIFEYSFGINGKSKKTGVELAVMYKVSRRTIVKIKSSILKELKKLLNI